MIVREWICHEIRLTEKDLGVVVYEVFEDSKVW